MKLFRNVSILLLAVLAGSVIAEDKSGWKFVQQIQMDRSGLVKVALPEKTLDAARPGLEDLRIFDASGKETPYLVQNVKPDSEEIRPAKTFRVVLEKESTVILIETGLDRPVDVIQIDTPASAFIKAANLEGSLDNQKWTLLLSGAPVFRGAGGEANLQLNFKPSVWPYLRIVLDDARTAQIPVSGIRIHRTPEEAPKAAMDIRIRERKEEPGLTRLELDLGSRNLTVASISLITGDPLFTRNVSVKIRRIRDHVVDEQFVSSGTISRIAIEGQTTAENLEIPVESLIPSRQVLLFIENQQSPPIAVSGVTAMRRPVYVLFLAKNAMTYSFFTGNPRAAAPVYDLSFLSTQLKSASLSNSTSGPLSGNPDYHPAGPLPENALTGTTLDVSDWKYRKDVKAGASGVQQVELDLQVLSHMRGDLSDLRLLQQTKQMPYLIEKNSWSRSIKPVVSTQTDSKRPRTSLWVMKLPYADLPVDVMTCKSRSSLFRRSIRLYEDRKDERGSSREYLLAQAEWMQSGDSADVFFLSLQEHPQTDTLFLETDNGDNPALALQDFELLYRATRLLFLPSSPAKWELYYGNEKASYPRYDIELVAQQFMDSERADAALGPEQNLKAPGAREAAQQNAGVIFWIALGLAVIVLFFVVSRLLPKEAPK